MGMKKYVFLFFVMLLLGAALGTDCLAAADECMAASDESDIIECGMSRKDVVKMLGEPQQHGRSGVRAGSDKEILYYNVNLFSGTIYLSEGKVIKVNRNR